jgi:hypothetical protein
MKLQQAYAIESPRRREIKVIKGPWTGLVAACTLAGSVAIGVVGLAATDPGYQIKMQAPLVAVPSSSQQAQEPEAPPGQPAVEPADDARKKEIAEESARLLRMATELKTEVDKTTKDTLSMQVIRKASEIERLAHDVKGNTKPTAKGK